MLAAEGGYVHREGDDDWWLVSGRVLLSPATDGRLRPRSSPTPARHFFQPHRFRDPFHRTGFETETVLTYDDYDLLVTADPRCPRQRDLGGDTTTACCSRGW